jgi:hypothetical protein
MKWLLESAKGFMILIKARIGEDDTHRAFYNENPQLTRWVDIISFREDVADRNGKGIRWPADIAYLYPRLRNHPKLEV